MHAWPLCGSDQRSSRGRTTNAQILVRRKVQRAASRLALAAVLAAGILAVGVGSASAVPASSWPSGGHDLSNSHSNSAETMINPQNVVHLAPKWKFTTHEDVSAIPAVVGGAVYFPDWAGWLNKVRHHASSFASRWTSP